MTLSRQPQNVEELRELLAHRTSRMPAKAAAAMADAHELVIFGSVARGVDGPTSDLDVLAIGAATRARSRSVDFVAISRERISERWWLGSELAGHVARYGIWLRGTPSWRESAFVSDWSIRKKSARILALLSELYVRRHILSSLHITRYAERVVLELARLELLQRRAFITATDELRDDLIANDFAVVDAATELLGAPCSLMLEEVLDCHWTTRPRATVDSLFRESWARQLASAQAWREAGRPGAWGE